MASALIEEDVLVSPLVLSRRALLILASVRPGERYILPFFAHHELGSVLFTDEDGEELRQCEDTTYEAVDHRLLWIRYHGLDREAADKDEECEVKVRVYWTETEEHELEDVEVAVMKEVPSMVSAAPVDEVLILAEYFAEAPLLRETDARVQWSLRDTPGNLASNVKLADHPGGPGSKVLSMDSSSDEVVMVCRLPLRAFPGRMQLRARFYDKGEHGAHHWLGFTAGSGAVAIGVHPAIEGHYACFCSGDAEGSWGAAISWQQVRAVRKAGWHVWELTLEEKWLSFVVDGVIQGGMPAPTLPGADEEICLGAAGGPGTPGLWGSLELLHTPFGDKRWEAGIQAPHPGRPFTWRPWRVRDLETGRWEFDAAPGARVRDVAGDLEAFDLASEDEDEKSAEVPAEENGSTSLKGKKERHRPRRRPSNERDKNHRGPGALEARLPTQ